MTADEISRPTEANFHGTSTSKNHAPTMIFLLLLLIFFPVGLPAASTKTEVREPNLIVVIVVDQMRADYLTRFGDLFGEGGFRLLMEKGAMFTNCSYDYAATYTGPGHSTILSGIPVSTSGIIGNDWFDRQRQQTVYCVEDTATRSVGIDPDKPAGRMSPVRFRGTTLGDELVARSLSSRVVGIAIKDRGAILLAGQHPTGAFWFDPESGNWITSSHYCRTLPGWVERFNAKQLATATLGNVWTALLPDSCYARSTADDSPGEGQLPGEKVPIFPHTVNDLRDHRSGGFARFDAMLPTPYGDDLTARFSEAAIDGEELGQRGVTDLLAISFSSPDYCGHLFGPDSREMEDILLRLDRTLQGLFACIDDRIGLDNVVIVLTADHGVCPLPELNAARGAERVNPKDLLLDIKVRVGQEFNYNEGNDNLLLALSNSFIYLDVPGIRAHGFKQEAFETAVMRAVMKENGIVRCYTREELRHLLADSSATDSLGLCFARSLNNDRSGDIALLTSEYSIYSGGSTGTTHGSPYWYDRHVPLLLVGPGIKAGRYDAVCRPNDIAPTLAELMQVLAPQGTTGTPLGILRSRFARIVPTAKE